MRLVGDDRAAAIQVGAIILFSFVVLAIAAYQANVVPAQNNKVEFDHNQRVQNEMLELRSAAQTAGTTGGSRAVSVTLGTTYPARTIFRNPPDPRGRLRTLGTGDPTVNATIRGADASGEVGDYWNGSARSFDTGAIAYRPRYNEYENAPTTVYEHSLVYNRFPNGANQSIADQTVVDGSTITLITLNGSLDEQGRSATSVDVQPISVASNTVTVANSSGLTITLPTLASEQLWREQLAGENVSAGGNVSDVDYREGSGRLNYVTIDLAPGEYTLRLGRVGVGDNVETGQQSGQSAYATTVGSDTKSVQTGESFQVTVEVRDAYDNPVRGENVTFDPSWTGTVNATTGDDGRATVSLTAPASSGSETVTAEIDGGDTAAETATFDVDVTSGGGGGGGGGYTVFWTDPSGQSGTTDCSADRCTLTGSDSLTLTVDTDPTADGARVEYVVNDTTVATVSPNTGTTNNAGENTTTLTAESSGAVRVYATSGNSADTIVVEIRLGSGLVWKTALDWDELTSQVGVVSEDFGDRTADEVQVGYPSGGQWGPQPVAYYPLDEDSGSTATDVVGGYDGTVNDRPNRVRGVLGTSSYDFDNTDDSVLLDGGTGGLSSQMSDETFTVSYWMNAPSKSNGKFDPIFDIYDRSTNTYPFTIAVYNSEIYLYDSDTGSYQGTGVTVSDGSWHHVAVTYDGSSMELYVDGTLQYSDTVAFDVEDGDEIRLAQSAVPRFYEGNVDELQVFGDSLTGTEVQQLTNVRDGGEFVTEIRTNSQRLNVSDLRLENVTADPNGGTITVRVRSDYDDDGTWEEESDPISLTAGQSTYTVTGLTDGLNSKNFSLNVSMTTGGVTSTPVLDQVEINGSVVDTTAPTISNFNATNPSGTQVQVQFDSSEQLSTIDVGIVESGSTVTNLTASDFSVSGSGPYTYTATFDPGSSGTYEAVLNVAADAAGNDGASGQNDTVSAGGATNQDPSAEFTYSPSNPDTSDTVEFDPSSSTDPDGTISEYRWDFDGDGTVDNTTSSATNVTYSYADDGTYQVNLTVVDDDGTVNSTTTAVTVSNVEPTANFTFTPSSPVAGDSVEFNASNSSDSDGSVQQYEWDWDDDGTYEDSTSNPTINHTFAGPGTYNVTLRVTDDDGATNVTSKNVSVAREPLFTAVSPDPIDGRSEATEFVRVVLPSDPDTSTWTVETGDGDVVTLGRNVAGEVYITYNKQAFLERWSINSSRVIDVDTRILANSGEQLLLKNASGTVVDEVAYGSETTSGGWSLSLDAQNDKGNVGRRIRSGGGYNDTDKFDDWTEINEYRFSNTRVQNTPAPGITYVDRVQTDSYSEYAIRSLDTAGRVGVYPDTQDKQPKGLGPMESDIDGDGLVEVVYVNGNSDLVITDREGNRQVVPTGGEDVKPKHLAVNGSSIYYVSNNGNRLTYVTNTSSGWSSIQRVTYTQGNNNPTVQATSIGGIGDVDDDGTLEIVYTESSKVAHVNITSNDRTVLSNIKVGSNNGKGIGSPADFDDDGIPRIPIVTGNNKVKLVNASDGTDQFVSSTYKSAVKAPLTTQDVNGDGTEEIVFVNTSNYLVAMNYSTGTVTTVTDQNGNPIRAKTSNGEGTARITPLEDYVAEPRIVRR